MRRRLTEYNISVLGSIANLQVTAHRTINAAMVAAYWEIGRVVVEEQQQGQERAEYGKGLLVELSQRLTAEFGRGFDRTNLQKTRAFYLTYQIRDALRLELSWTHYRLLLRVESPEARAFYETEAVNAHWSTRELEQSCVTRCPRTTSRFLPLATNSTCPPKRN